MLGAVSPPKDCYRNHHLGEPAGNPKPTIMLRIVLLAKPAPHPISYSLIANEPNLIAELP